MSNPVNHLGLVIIDIQERLLPSVSNPGALTDSVRFCVQAAQLLGIEVAVVEHQPDKLGSTVKSVEDVLLPDTPRFHKTEFACTSAEGFDRWLETNQLDHLLICGLETPICIYQSAIALLSDDLGVTLLSDAISERRPEDRDPTLRQLLSIDAHVLSSETIFYSLLGGGAHPQFDEFQTIVKERSSRG